MPSRSRDGVYTRRDRPGYWISYKDTGGRRRRCRVMGATTRTQATKILNAKRMRSQEAKDLGYTPPSDCLFAEVCDRFLKHQKPRLSVSAYERERGIVEDHLKPFFPGELRAIRRADVQDYESRRLDEVGPGTVAKELRSLKHLLRLASDDWELIPTNPARGVNGPKPPAGRVRYLQPGELRAVVEACPEWLRVIVALAVSTGMRRGEILKIRWLDIDLTHGHVLLPQTKNGSGRIVYLNKLALAAIRSIPSNVETGPADLLFPSLTGPQVSMHFARVCRRLRIADFRFHDLRHTAASWLRMKGADIHTVASLLGHKDLRMAARYQHLSPEFLAEAVGRLDEAFGEEMWHRSVTGPKALAAAVAASA